MTRDQQRIVDELLGLDAGLTPWEILFIESIDRDWRDRDLSAKMTKTIEDIRQRRLP